MSLYNSLKSLYEDRQLVYDVLDNLPLGVIALDASSKPIFINQTLSRLVGVPLKRILNATETDLSKWFKADPGAIDLMQKCLSGETILSRRQIVSEQGETIPILVHGFPLYNKQGIIFGVFGLVEDLRQQLIWERSHQEYLHVMDTIMMGMVTVDNEGTITNCNKYVTDRLGPLNGKKVREVLWDFGHGDSIIAKALKGETVSIPETTFEFNSHKALVSLDCAPLRDSSGNITGAMALGRDITMQRAMEEEAHRAEKLSIVGELAAGIAHEIRNPLTSVRGFIQLLKNRYSPTAPEQDYFDIMLGELDRANGIIKEFLLLAKPQTPVLQLQDINNLLEDLLKLVEGEALMADVELIRQFSPDTPLMMMEPEAIKQVFLNIIQNAIQAMPKGGKLTIITLFNKDKNEIIIKIVDTGVGIPKHLLDQLGKPFVSTRRNGTGLGLMVSYKIMQNHNGKIEVESEENVGTTFKLILPINS